MGHGHTIAIDFDATLTIDHGFPNIGQPRMWLIKKAIEWRKRGDKLILWTCREDIPHGIKCYWSPRNYLTEAVEWCKGFGLEFDAINASIDEAAMPDYKWGRKIFANLYIDDSSVVFSDLHENFRSLNDKALFLE